MRPPALSADRSRMSFTRLARCFPLFTIKSKLLQVLCERAPVAPSISDSARPMIPFNGVLRFCKISFYPAPCFYSLIIAFVCEDTGGGKYLSSWLVLARN